MRLHERQPERVTERDVDELAEACLRLLGLRATEARRLARLPLPDLPPDGLAPVSAPAATNH